MYHPSETGKARRIYYETRKCADLRPAEGAVIENLPAMGQGDS